MVGLLLGPGGRGLFFLRLILGHLQNNGDYRRRKERGGRGEGGGGGGGGGGLLNYCSLPKDMVVNMARLLAMRHPLLACSNLYHHPKWSHVQWRWDKHSRRPQFGC